MSPPERLLWRELRQCPAGLKFRKQHPASYFTLDFYCAAAKLCIEVDGQHHNLGDQPDFDRGRDAFLKRQDIETFRIAAVEILSNLEGAVTHIVQAARARLPLHRPAGGPPPRAGEEL